MGTSGSGKSTLMNILGCLDRPTSGTYELDGKDVTRMGAGALSRVRNERIGFIFQSFRVASSIHGFEECGTAAYLLGHRLVESPGAGEEGAGYRRSERPHEASAEPALRWAAAARGDCPGACRRAGHSAGRRADGKSRQRHDRRNSRVVRGTASARADDHHGYPRNRMSPGMPNG